MGGEDSNVAPRIATMVRAPAERGPPRRIPGCEPPRKASIPSHARESNTYDGVPDIPSAHHRTTMEPPMTRRALLAFAPPLRSAPSRRRRERERSWTKSAPTPPSRVQHFTASPSTTTGTCLVAGGLAGAGKVWKVGSGGSPVTEFATGFVDPRGLAFDAAGNLSRERLPGQQDLQGHLAGVKTTFVSASRRPRSSRSAPAATCSSPSGDSCASRSSYPQAWSRTTRRPSARSEKR